MSNNHPTTIKQLYPALLSQLAAWKVDIEGNPADWHSSFQRALEVGAFVKLTFAFGRGGVIAASLVCVSPDGVDTTTLSTAEVPHA